MHNSTLSSRAGATAVTPTREYLAFRLGDEVYAIDILKVQEIRVFEAVTKLPGAPDYIKGVINLRGLIAPVLDLRVKFGFKEAAYGPFTVVVVLYVHDRLVAVVADAVIDVVALTEDEIKPPPEFATSVNVEYVMGLGASGDHMLILLDIEKLVSSQELGLFDAEATA
ncbi:MAG TPA: chemotaxis protein CheW [Burkholderiales bacterium]|nr:chemotaxis protein CheW [Burkholderiales bacterium]